MNESVSRVACTSMWIARLDKHVNNTPERLNSLRPSLINEPRTKIVDSAVSEGRCWYQSVYVQILPSSTLVVPQGVFGKSRIWRYRYTQELLPINRYPCDRRSFSVIPRPWWLILAWWYFTKVVTWLLLGRITGCLVSKDTRTFVIQPPTCKTSFPSRKGSSR